MATEQAAPPVSAAAPSVDGAPQTVKPNQYHLSGHQITVTYFPDGFGPLPKDQDGPDRLFYQDPHRHLVFNGSAIRKADVPDLGTVLSVTIVRTVDVGSTTFSVILPDVNLPAEPNASTRIETEGVTTVHRAFVALIGHPQVETYTVTRLTGEASHGILPL